MSLQESATLVLSLYLPPSTFHWPAICNTRCANFPSTLQLGASRGAPSSAQHSGASSPGQTGMAVAWYVSWSSKDGLRQRLRL